MSKKLLSAGVICVAAMAICCPALANPGPAPAIRQATLDLLPNEMSKAPEPADWVILVTGFAIVGGRARRRRRRPQA